MDEKLEAAWVAGLREGDAHSYQSIVEATIGRLLNVARRYLGEDEARDAVQETYLKLYQSINQFRGQASLLTWMQKILVNECLGRIRRKKARPETSIEDLLPEFRDDGHRVNPLPPWPDSSSSAMQRERQCELVTEHLQKLPQSLRNIILLRDIEGYSGQETAEALDISVGAVKVRLHRARQALRQLLEPTMVGEANDL